MRRALYPPPLQPFARGIGEMAGCGKNRGLNLSLLQEPQFGSDQRFDPKSLAGFTKSFSVFFSLFHELLKETPNKSPRNPKERGVP